MRWVGTYFDPYPTEFTCYSYLGINELYGMVWYNDITSVKQNEFRVEFRVELSSGVV